MSGEANGSIQFLFNTSTQRRGVLQRNWTSYELFRENDEILCVEVVAGETQNPTRHRLFFSLARTQQIPFLLWRQSPSICLRFAFLEVCQAFAWPLRKLELDVARPDHSVYGCIWERFFFINIFSTCLNRTNTVLWMSYFFSRWRKSSPTFNKHTQNAKMENVNCIKPK